MEDLEVRARQLHQRSGDFIRSASHLCDPIHDGWVPSSCLLLGFAAELMAKRRLLLLGHDAATLRHQPYGHDIARMWKTDTRLFVDALTLVEELKKKPNPDGVGENFDFPLHFETLARAHSREGDYSLRYHGGVREFADPKAMCIVLGNLWISEDEACV